jgi:hypothetical protein
MKKILFGLILIPNFYKKTEIASYLKAMSTLKIKAYRLIYYSFQNNSSERLSTGTFSTPYKAVALATSPLLGMVRFIRYPKK